MFDNADVVSSVLVRAATLDDVAEIDELRKSSIERLLVPVLDPDQRQVLLPYMPTDVRLIEDRTYFVAEVNGRIAASGGWSRRSIFIRVQGQQRDERLLDPVSEPAAIRAMYTHPDFARYGLGSVLLQTAEAAARLGGFQSARLIATPAGERLFLARGWSVIDQVWLGPDSGPKVALSIMGRHLCRQTANKVA